MSLDTLRSQPVCRLRNETVREARASEKVLRHPSIRDVNDSSGTARGRGVFVRLEQVSVIDEAGTQKDIENRFLRVG